MLFLLLGILKFPYNSLRSRVCVPLMETSLFSVTFHRKHTLLNLFQSKNLLKAQWMPIACALHALQNFMHDQQQKYWHLFLSFWSSNDARSNPWSVGHSRVSSQRRSAGRHPRHHPDRPAQTGRALQPRRGSVSSHPEQTRQETVRRHQGWGENETSHLRTRDIKAQFLNASGNSDLQNCCKNSNSFS